MGKSSSSQQANTTYTTNNTDKRITAQGPAISADHSTVTMQVLDGGAVAGAIDLAKAGRQQDSEDFASIIGAGKYLLDKAYSEVDASRLAMKETLSSVGQVYQQAREQELTKDSANTKSILTVAGFAVVGLVALQAAKKG